ncbi:glycosyl hydrolase [Clostridium gelidum]|uniref:Sucrose-6-phosphate hydrolase n=1 Tax=Clostridium gelidum TaxID=704125 RepID=A0ABM7TK28_9CLOT|nr:glycoside hydrolase family 32 protein [Clostridium gelidum]BCZ48715.1 glycosyl hydrolase [Clostridium gelidum]
MKQLDSVLEELQDSKVKSKQLEEALEFIKNNKYTIKKENKPKYHVIGDIGWINDPNGFSCYKGEYHLFYQYYPYDIKWGPMHWGHATTKDFIKWTPKPVALAPDESYDENGCFSGSAIQVGDKHVLMYTAHLDPDKENPQSIRQTQCIAIGDGKRYVKVEENPVIKTEQIISKSNLSDFRDPKIWEKDGHFYVVVGSRHEDGSGQILLYKSENLVDWSFVGVMCRSENKLGRMWECPDLFELDEYDVLLTSPQEMKPEVHRFQNVFGTICMIGKVNYETGEYTYDICDEIDGGLDFYAPQTLITPDNRRIMIAWMQSWERNIPSDKFGFTGMMTIPRELTVKNNKLIQNPVREIENYRSNKIEYKNVKIDGDVRLDNIEGNCIDLIIEIPKVDYMTFEIKLFKNEEFETVLSYNAKEKVLTFDRSNSGSGINALNKTTTKIESGNDEIKLRLLIDLYSVEVFVNDGEYTMTSTVYSPENAQEISFYSDKQICVNIEKWNIE